MRHLRTGLGGLVAICVTLRVAAWLVAPVLPLLVVLFAMAVIVNVMFGRHRRW